MLLGSLLCPHFPQAYVLGRTVYPAKQHGGNSCSGFAMQCWRRSLGTRFGSSLYENQIADAAGEEMLVVFLILSLCHVAHKGPAPQSGNKQVNMHTINFSMTV